MAALCAAGEAMSGAAEASMTRGVRGRNEGGAVGAIIGPPMLKPEPDGQLPDLLIFT
jgi:hypothetical protein